VTGETLKVYASGNDSEIKSMMHGQADVIVRAFKAAKQAPATQSAPVAPSRPASDDPFAQLERHGELRDKGLISDDDYEAKKAELLDHNGITKSSRWTKVPVIAVTLYKILNVLLPRLSASRFVHDARLKLPAPATCDRKRSARESAAASVVAPVTSAHAKLSVIALLAMLAETVTSAAIPVDTALKIGPLVVKLK
jgi:hypothetical protein